MKFGVLLFLLVVLAISADARGRKNRLAELLTGFRRTSCFKKAETGPCKAAFVRWAYNRWTCQCETFIYGGCGGNENNFETQEECESKCNFGSICNLPADVGPCEALFPRWYYDSDTERCEPFIYGGCEGNKNNFETLADCQQRCEPECKFIYCFADPCEHATCPAYPYAQCVANYCNGCNAEFYLNHERVDCDDKTCPDLEEECRNPNFKRDHLGNPLDVPSCCDDAVCCVPTPPVIYDGYEEPEFGTCQKRCIPLKG